MNLFDLSQVMEDRARSGRAYLEFLRVPSLSMGLYVLPAHGVDSQQPHAEDEVYHVVSGRGTVRVGEEEREVGPGVTVYVPAGVEHRFQGIREELRLLVFFAPAETGLSEP